MTTFTFIHTGDWHIGKPFGRFPAEQAAVLRRARLLAIDRIADAAGLHGALHVLVAGDLYDRPGLPDRDLEAPLAAMSSHRQLIWHVIPGNHDPAVTGGAWERARRGGLPANVRLYLDSTAVEIAPAVWLLPAPLAAKAMTRDPTAWMDESPTPPGALRIGLAHGSIQGFGGDKAASIRIAPDRARRAGLSWLALGDWHGYLQADPRTAYCGTPEPDAFLDNVPGGALAVSIESATSPPRVTRCEIARHRWLKRSLDAARTTDLAALEDEVEGWGSASREVLLEVELRGRASIGEEQGWRTRLDRLAARVFHLERLTSNLVVHAADDDLDRLGEGSVRAIAAALSAEAAPAKGRDAAVAARALRHLFDLASTLETATREGAPA